MRLSRFNLTEENNVMQEFFIFIRTLSLIIGLLFGGSSLAMAVTASQFTASWGAVATSSQKAGAIGTSNRQASKADAKQAAITACSKVYKTECEVEESFYDQCIGIAAARKNPSQFYFSTEDYDKTQLKQIRKSVSQQAIQRCEQKTGTQCVEINAYCTDYTYKNSN